MGAFGSRNSRNDSPLIEEFESALEGGRPIVVWVYTESSDRSLRRKRAASDRLWENVLNTPAATAMLARCVCIKIEGEDMDRDLARYYGLSRTSIPQLVVYDYEGDRLGRINTSITPEGLASALENAIERCNAMMERED